MPLQGAHGVHLRGPDFLAESAALQLDTAETVATLQLDTAAAEVRWTDTHGELVGAELLAASGAAIVVSGAADLTAMTAKLDEIVTFRIQLHQSCLEGAEVCLSCDGHRVLLHTPVALLPIDTDGAATLSATLTEPGFLRCRVGFLWSGGAGRRGVCQQNSGGVVYPPQHDRRAAIQPGRRSYMLAGVAYEPAAIRPTCDNPPDFASFWAQEKAALALVHAAP